MAIRGNQIAKDLTERQMLSFVNRSIAALSLIAALSCFVSGCGVTLSPVKRAPLQISPLKTTFAPNSQTILVRFESTVAGEPLSDTVWDNVSGAFVDVRESKQIGYTQDYSKLIPATALGGVAAGVAVGTRPDYTRIVIPFGRIFEGEFQSGLQNTFPNALVAFNDSGESVASKPTTRYVVRLKVTEFQVWENPLNHVNLKAVVECKVDRVDKITEPEFDYEAKNIATNQSIGSMMTISTGFINNLNKISNEFAASLSRGILENLQKKAQGDSPLNSVPEQ